MKCSRCSTALDERLVCDTCSQFYSREREPEEMKSWLLSCICREVEETDISWQEIPMALAVAEKYGITHDEIDDAISYRHWKWKAPLLELTEDDMRQIERITSMNLQVRRMSSGPFRHGFTIFKNKQKDEGEFTTPGEDVIEVLGSDEEYPLSWLFPTYKKWTFGVARYTGGMGPGDFWHEHDSLQSAVEDVIDFYSRPERMDKFSEFCRLQYEATNPVGHHIKVPPDHPNYENWIRHKTGGAS